MSAGTERISHAVVVAGLFLATRLGHALGRRGHGRITLVDRNPTHVRKPTLHTFAAGTWNIQQQRAQYLTPRAPLQLRPRPAGRHRPRRPAHTAGTDTGRRRADRRRARAGVRRADSGLRQLRQRLRHARVAAHCHFIDIQDQADAFNQRLPAQVVRSLTRVNEIDIGGGVTEVELGVEVRPGVLVIAADVVGFQLEGGDRMQTALKIREAGVHASDPFAVRGLPFNRIGQVVVGSDLLDQGEQQIFALGDCASLTPAGAQRALTSTAQVANQHALYLARHMPSWLHGERMPPFRFSDLGALVFLLSDYNAFGTLGCFGFFKGGFIRSRLALLSHAALYWRHQISLHGLSRTGGAVAGRADQRAGAAVPAYQLTGAPQ